MHSLIMNKSKETKFFESPETTTNHEIEARKLMVDFKFDAIYR